MSELMRWTGTEWESLSNGNPILIGGTNGILLKEYTVPTDTFYVGFPGLNSITDGDYIFEFSVKGALLSAGVGVNLYINGDVDNANYETQEQELQIGTLYNNSPSSPKLFTVQNGNTPIFGSYHIKISCGIVNIYGTNTRMIIAGGFYQVVNSIHYKTTIDAINTISLITNTAGTAIGAGSTFRLYGSKTPSNLISYDPIDYTGLQSDRYLKAGEVAYIDYTDATSVQLHIQTVEGVYELNILSNNYQSSESPLSAHLNPNNVETAAIISDSFMFDDVTDVETGSVSTPSYWKGQNSNITLGDGIIVTYEATITTYLANKSVISSSINRFQTTTRNRRGSVLWRDTSTHWTSLGTIIFGNAQSGKIIIRRII